MKKLKLHKPLTITEIEKMTDLEKRRLLVKDILLQVDLGLMDGKTGGYINNDDVPLGGACHVCFVGAGYVTGKALLDEPQDDGESYHEFFKKFGFEPDTIFKIENVFEEGQCHTDYTHLQDIFHTLYPGREGRTGRLRAVYQYIWDNPDCQFVPLEENK